ncbi:hypothetical protein JW948_02200 [bacterium]|nr:hypothetical protein [bacterium]
MKKFIFIIQGILQIYVGLGALVCGILMMADPSGGILKMPLSLIEASPFHNYLIPGLILFAVNGLGQLFAGVLSLRKHAWSGLVSAVFGLGLMIWIFVQVTLIGGGHILQNLYFGFGTAETAMAFLMHVFLTAAKKPRPV